ncbi:hypothetical protein BC827DRAFT_1266096 [Russula dissimulans]|nr:hypothetical protein BC827DRAFT_1266096 [Russula dissimulans]
MISLDWRKLRTNRLVRLFVPNNLPGALRLGWVILVVWGEIGVFLYTLSVCRWPEPTHDTADMSRSRTTRVLLVADAQLPMSPVHSQTFTGLFHNIYMRRAWKVTRYLHPHHVFFLGDMLKTGRSVQSDDEFSAYVRLFEDRFPLDPGVEARYIPGNADVGLGVSNTFSKHVRQRYEGHFGHVNQHLYMANHSLVLLDSPGIVDEDYIRAGHGTSFEEWIPLRDGAIEFVKGLAAEEKSGPVILFTHIPLHRAESKKCGPLRERGTIHRGVGHGWQKTLGKHTSSFLLENLRPVVIFSADDRDYCDVRHSLPDSDKQMHEITVKSFSPARHITQPGFHLLSLYPGPVPSHAHAPCLLPRADGTFLRLYIPAIGLTVAILFFVHMRGARHAARLRLATASLPSHVDVKVRSAFHPTLAPSPYSASSAYSYTYPYSNMPPSSQGGRDRNHVELPQRNSKPAQNGHRGLGALRTAPLPIPPGQDEDEQDGPGHLHLSRQWQVQPHEHGPSRTHLQSEGGGGVSR